MNLKFCAAILISTLFLGASAGAEQIEQRVSKSGAVFTRDTSNPNLGEAYSDPSGLIWGEVISDSMNHFNAAKECAYSFSGYWLATWPYRDDNTDYYRYDRNQEHAVRCVSRP